MASFTDPLPCGPFTTPSALLTCCKAATDAGMDENDPHVLDAIADASLLLYYWTGRTYGTCTTTLRLCRSCNCSGTCGCGVNSIDLGLWPVVGLQSVRYDGVLQDLADFHIDEFHYLVRSGPQDPWPTCTNMWAETGGPYDSEDPEYGHVFEVTFDYGIDIPSILERAARALACELLSSACGAEQACKLPERVTSVARRGLTMEVASSNDLLRDGMTGIYVVDLAVKTLNPSKLQSPSFIWSPDLARNRNRRVFT